MSEEKIVSIDFYGLPLWVTGDYSEPNIDIYSTIAQQWLPGDDAEFNITSIAMRGIPLDGEKFNPESIITRGGLWNTLEKDCLEKILED